ncbi:unnamed protein product [Chondrus crispus]|uniref:Uncharacterized protein n=1 Tax=Chondrus crispus TaxID=2769 RepID=R7Q8K0_CHOCR|nr:unnamed protein product [Chondrus crispus]CDF33716.1 unnamed protein product [Chondrus crispus]|eukprot:XP_005713535.1 unnamed protein product [Chondrus crispus]
MTHTAQARKITPSFSHPQCAQRIAVEHRKLAEIPATSTQRSCNNLDHLFLNAA